MSKPPREPACPPAAPGDGAPPDLTAEDYGLQEAAELLGLTKGAVVWLVRNHGLEVLGTGKAPRRLPRATVQALFDFFRPGGEGPPREEGEEQPPQKTPVRLLDEPGLDPVTKAAIDAVEEDPAADGMDLEQWAEFLVDLAPGKVHGYWWPDPQAGEPTGALPGTREKLRVMARRAKLGLCLFHPGDAKPQHDEQSEEHDDG